MVHKDPNCFCKRAYFCCKVQHFYVKVYDRSLWWPPEELQVFFHLIISPNSDQRNLQKTQSRHTMFHVLLWGRLQTPHHSAGHQLMRRLAVQFPAAPVCVPNILICSSLWILDQKHLDVERCMLGAQEPSIYQLKPRPQKSLHHRSLSPGAVPAGNASHNEISNSCKPNSFTSHSFFLFSWTCVMSQGKTRVD